MQDRTVGLSFMKYLLFAYVLTGALLLLISLLQLAVDIPESVLSVCMTIIYILSGGFAGYLAGKRVESRGFLFGLLMGCAYFLVLTLISLSVGNKTLEWNREFFSVLFLCVSSGMLGGILGRGK